MGGHGMSRHDGAHPRSSPGNDQHSLKEEILKYLLLKMIAAGVLFAQQGAPALILTNGKVITVDESFTISQAIAIKGDRFVAVGGNQEITALAGPNTKRIDLRGRSVVPGMIDNHAHLMRAGETWTEEVRLDGIESRK